MSALSAVMYREGKIRATNALFIFWDVVYPLGYLLVFGVGMNKALGFGGLPTDYHAFFLAGVLGSLLVRTFHADQLHIRTPVHTSEVTSAIFRVYIIPFEVVGVLLLGALIGAVVLARRD